MMDIDKKRQKLSRLEAHVAWIRQHIGDGATLERRLAEISKLRANIAADTQTKCQVAWHSD